MKYSGRTAVWCVLALILIVTPGLLWATASFSSHYLATFYMAYDSVIADLDSDGDKDIVAGTWGGALSWWRNNGSQSFTKVDISSSLGAVAEVHVADMDGDSDRDILVVDYGADAVKLFTNNGSQTFSVSTVMSSVDDAINIAIADMDGDGDQDILTAERNHAHIALGTNNGGGSFASTIIGSGSNLNGAYGVRAGDLDGDGDQDVAAAAATNDKVVWLQNNGGGSYTQLPVGIAAFGQGIDTADFDGDGDRDVIVGDVVDGAVYWYSNSGTGSFTRFTAKNGLNDPSDTEVMDIDGDGDQDVLLSDQGNLQILWLENDGTQTFSTQTIASSFGSSGCGPANVNGGDVDSDGDFDVTAGSYCNSNLLYWWEQAGTPAPDASAYSPTDNATNISATTNLVITFDAVARAGTGTLTVKKTSDNSTVETITVSGSQLSGNGTTQLTLDPSVTLESNTSYYVVWDGNAFKSTAGIHTSALISTTTWNFTTTDTTPPSISSLSPTDDATNVSPTANLVLTFDKTTRAGTGTLTIKKTSDNSTVETITISGAQLSGNSTTQLTLNPISTLTESTEFYVVWNVNAFKNTGGYHSAAQTSATYWNFTTGDYTAPTVSSLSPADNATGVSRTANPAITFDETARAGTGTLTIKKSSDNSTVETITVSGSQLSGNGTTQLTLNPATTLNESTSYYIVWSAHAFKDSSVNRNHAAATSSSTYWNFTTTGAAPVITGVAGSPASSGATIIWNTDENASSRVQYGLTPSLGSATSEEDTGTGVTSHEVTLSGLPLCTTYYYRPLSADPSGNSATGSTGFFTTTSCTASATVSSQTGSNMSTSGGSLDMTNGGSGAALTVPADASTNTFTLQIKKIDMDAVVAATSTPTGTEVIGDHTYDFRAISGTTIVTSFLQAITVTMEYTDAQVSGYDESSLWIYRWDGSSWNALSGCTVDTSANTVTCTTTAFSTFGLFGETEGSGDGTEDASTASAQTSGGRRGDSAGMATRIAAAREYLLARFTENLRQSVALEEEPTHAAAEVPGALATSEERSLYRAAVKSQEAASERAAGNFSLSRIAERRGMLLVLIDETPILYHDVPVDAWFAPYIAELAGEGIATGYADAEGIPTGEFGIANPVTLAEVLKMAMKSAGTDFQRLPPPRNLSAQGTWASAYASAAEAKQLSLVTHDCNLHAPATRAEIVRLILEILELPIANQAPAFSDVPENHPHAAAIATAAFYGIVQGDSPSGGLSLNMFRPDDEINRAEAAKMIALLKEVMGME